MKFTASVVAIMATWAGWTAAYFDGFRSNNPAAMAGELLGVAFSVLLFTPCMLTMLLVWIAVGLLTKRGREVR